ncbi:MAG TPA: NusA-like transcription termination signal-binding factor, partial [Methanothermococcus okinawensis]|nr:NusA-like transcription termination signal-binding factor [Methanothermococcus okinawensis]
MKVRLTREDIMKINFFEKLTGAEVIDCVSDDERIVFVVKEGNMGAAIGRGGENVKTAMEKFNKKIDIVEYSKDLKKFVRNIFEPLKLEDVWIKKQNGKVVVYVRV